MSKFSSPVVIGLEIHVELATQTKIFCRCKREATEGEGPNTRTCPVCLGHPGSKPVFNKKVLEYALRLGLALHCTINKELIFSRKSYFYPDLAKNYQISQYDLPLGQNGTMKISTGTIGITRVHVEEDPASLVHPKGMGAGYVLIDYNRSGNPLVEVVTEPDMKSPEEAREFMNKLITMLDYLEIFDIDKCIIKADANVSIKESGYVRSEIKNVTGFKEIERALFYEVQRQKHAVTNGEKIIQDTRSWDADKGATTRMRTKETEEDYGYIIDPDLVAIPLDPAYVSQVKQDLPEMADEKLEKYKEEHGIKADTAAVLAKDKVLASVFEKVSKKVNPDLAAKWIRRELPRVLNYNKKKFSDVDFTEEHLIALLLLIQEGKITDKVAQKILEKLCEGAFDVNSYVKNEGLETVGDSSAIEVLCKEVITEHGLVADEVRSGNEKSINFLVGQVMKKSRGKADPKIIHEALKKLL